MSSKRIAINVAASYAQTAVSFVVGIFASRWVFNALGETRYGVFSVVGALIAFVAVLNGVLIVSSGRFFAFAIGRQRLPGADKNELCKWFNTAVCCQIIIPTILVAIGLPAGLYAIQNFLNIPDDLRSPSRIVFFCSLFTMWSGMLFSPILSLYTAKQYIFVKNIFTIFSMLVMAAEGWWLLHFEGNRLTGHAIAVMILHFIINMMLAILAFFQFNECRINIKYWFDKKRLREMFSFSAFQLFVSLGWLFSSSGVSVVLNKFFGPSANAAMGNASTLYSKAVESSNAVTGALFPEITARVGEGKFDSAVRLAERACLISSVIALFFASPMTVYSERLMVLWLKNPPEYAAQIVVIMMAILFFERMSAGYYMLVNASGKVKFYTICTGIGNGVRCFIVLGLLWAGVALIPALWLGWGLPFIILMQMRPWFVKKVLPISIKNYFHKVAMPVSTTTIASILFSHGFKTVVGNSILAMILCGIFNAAVASLVIYISAHEDDRKFFTLKARLFFEKLYVTIRRKN
jgi:hypothetical protein